MSTEDATYLIAHEQGIRIDQYLTSEQVDRVRALHHAQAEQHASVTRATAKARSKHGAPRELRFPGEFKATNPLLPDTKLNEAVEMARMYPLLYVLENSMRELIKRVMAAKHGPAWWDSELTSGKLRNVEQKAAGRMRTEETRHSWHQRRGAHPIDYVDLGDLGDIILGKQSHFIPDIIGDREWFIQFMKELEPSRNVVCHMNPLDAHNIQDLKLRVRRWDSLVSAARARIPT